MKGHTQTSSVTHVTHTPYTHVCGKDALCGKLGAVCGKRVSSHPPKSELIYWLPSLPQNGWLKSDTGKVSVPIEKGILDNDLLSGKERINEMAHMPIIQHQWMAWATHTHTHTHTNEMASSVIVCEGCFVGEGCCVWEVYTLMSNVLGLL